MTAPYPWQMQHWQYLQNLHQQKKLPHALLLTGQAGLGKQAFSDQFGKWLLCQAPSDRMPCEVCQSCRMIQNQLHPDHLSIRPEKPTGPITIVQVRSLANPISKTAQRSGMKWVSFESAERLNLAASNALLKILEEPPPQTMITLVTNYPNRLLPTLLSRCYKIRFCPPSFENTLAWLNTQLSSPLDLKSFSYLQGIGPLKAFQLVQKEAVSLRQKVVNDLLSCSENQSPMQLAASWIKNQPSMSLYYMYRCIVEVIAMQSQADAFEPLDDRMLRSADLLCQLPSQKLFCLLDKILETWKSFEGEGGRNGELMLGSLLIDWQNLLGECRDG